MKVFKFREATKEDVGLIAYFIQALAAHEEMLDQVIFDKEDLIKGLFEYQAAKVTFVLEGEKEVGFVLYFYNFSAFVGKPGICIKDVFVLPEYRGKGYGKALFRYIGVMACENDFDRVEWDCLNWNEKSIGFYASLGAKRLEDRSTYRLEGQQLSDLIHSS